jgi:hypothetical protein
VEFPHLSHLLLCLLAEKKGGKKAVSKIFVDFSERKRRFRVRLRMGNAFKKDAER